MHYYLEIIQNTNKKWSCNFVILFIFIVVIRHKFTGLSLFIMDQTKFQNDSNEKLVKLRLVFLNVIIPLLIGAIIYILFRKDTLLVFSWLKSLKLYDIVLIARETLVITKQMTPSYILFSLPDGIWVYAATSYFLIVWSGNIRDLNSLIWILLPVFCCVFTEFLQLLNLIQGTYCNFDLITYIIFFLLSFINFSKLRSSNVKNTIC